MLDIRLVRETPEIIKKDLEKRDRPDLLKKLEEVRKLNPDAKVICASGFLENSIREEMLAAGAVEFIQKPYVYTSLITLIRSLLSA